MAQIPKVAAVFAEPLLKRLAETVNAIIDRFLNTPALDESNTFTGTAQVLSNDTVRLRFTETDAATDNKNWEFQVASGGTLFGLVYNDDLDSSTTWVQVDRTGTTVDSIALAATAITLNGVSAADYARLSQSNSFTGVRQTISAGSPQLVFSETDAGINAKNWDITVFSGGTMQWRVVDDALSAGEAYFQIDRSGATVTTVNVPNGVLQYGGIEVGYRGTPINTQNGSYTTAPSDSGGTIYKASGGAGETITIDDSDHAVGTMLDVINNGGGTLTIAVDGGASLNWAQTGGTGSRTLADHGWAVLKKVAASTWWISGTGLT